MQRYQSDVSLLVPRSPWRARQTCPPDCKLFARSVDVHKAKRRVCGRAIRQLTLCGLCVEAEARDEPLMYETRSLLQVAAPLKSPL